MSSKVNFANKILVRSRLRTSKVSFNSFSGLTMNAFSEKFLTEALMNLSIPGSLYFSRPIYLFSSSSTFSFRSSVFAALV